MSEIRSRLDPRSATFRAHREAMIASLAALEPHFAASREGGSEKARTRHKERGKMLPRERVEALLDPDSYFLELCPLAGAGMEGIATGGSMIGGIGLVEGTECVVTATEAAIKGGALNEVSVKKGHRLAEVAEENGLPTLSCVESAGADLPQQSKIFVPGGQAFRDITRRSKARIPTICLVFGSSTAGGAYMPGMADYAVMVKKRAQVYLAGPPLVKMATGEVADDEALGGAEMHSRISGVSDQLAEDELDAIRLGRGLVKTLRVQKRGYGPEEPPTEPLYDREELLGIVPPDLKTPFDVREVIARIVDGSRFFEHKPLFGTTLVTGFAHLHGYPIGVIANNGVLFSEASQKGAQFIQLCNHRDIPLLFLQNIAGFMVGTKAEQEGIVKHGAKLINAVSNSEVPAITVMLGASYGAGNYGMCGRAYKPRFLFTWPTHRIAVMGGEQLAGVLAIVARGAAERRGETPDEAGIAAQQQMVRARIEEESSALYATARLWDDGIIDPRDTRTAVGIALSACHVRAVAGTTSWGVFRH